MEKIRYAERVRQLILDDAWEGGADRPPNWIIDRMTIYGKIEKNPLSGVYESFSVTYKHRLFRDHAVSLTRWEAIANGNDSYSNRYGHYIELSTMEARELLKLLPFVCDTVAKRNEEHDKLIENERQKLEWWP